MSLSKKLAKNLRARRGTRTQEEFAALLGISRPTLTRLENADQNTTLKTLEKVKEALHCRVAVLFGEERTTPSTRAPRPRATGKKKQ